MLTRTTDIVRGELAKGKDLEAIQADNVLAEWESFGESYTSVNNWIDYLVSAMIAPRPEKATYFEPIYYTLRDHGVEAAVDQYRELKATRYDEYRFIEDDLVQLAYKLYQNERHSEAIAFWELCAEEYPEGDYFYLCYDFMARSLDAEGDSRRAIECYRRSLEINPENSHAANELERLEKL